MCGPDDPSLVKLGIASYLRHWAQALAQLYQLMEGDPAVTYVQWSHVAVPKGLWLAIGI
jgi:hypothetical protein